MKKLSFVLALTLACSFSYAQIAQGTKWLSGSANFSSSDSKNTSSYSYYKNSQNSVHSISLSPTFGYFFRENQLIGAGILFSNSQSSFEGTYFSNKDVSSYESNLYGGQILYRKYFPITSKFYIATEGSISAQAGKGNSVQKRYQDNILTTERTENTNPFRAGLTAKAFIVYFITPTISTELSLGSLGFNYNQTKGTYREINYSNQEEISDDIKGDYMDFSSTFLFNNVSLGFQFYF